jgi:D-sedoheptulose 7-phosphate isomerase
MERIVTRDLILGSRVEEFSRLVSAGKFSDSSGDKLATEAGVDRILEELYRAKESGKGVFVVGNGGSAAVASHAVTDFLNKGELRASTLHDPALLTCMTNDYGYEDAFARILSVVARKGDMLFAISSSGQSVNIHNAIRCMQEIEGTTISLSGFKGDNPLRLLGDLNFWIDSSDYGFVEMGHLFLLHHIADRFASEKK